MSPRVFKILADKISSSRLVNKQLTRMKKPISVGKKWFFIKIFGYYEWLCYVIIKGERLAITLHFYATGDNLRTIAAGYCIGHSTACKIVVETGVVGFQFLQNRWAPLIRL